MTPDIRKTAIKAFKAATETLEAAHNGLSDALPKTLLTQLRPHNYSSFDRYEARSDGGLDLHFESFEYGPDVFTLTAEDLAAEDVVTAYFARIEAEQEQARLDQIAHAKANDMRALRAKIAALPVEERSTLVDALLSGDIAPPPEEV